MALVIEEKDQQSKAPADYRQAIDSVLKSTDFERFIKNAFEEDISTGDITGNSVVPAEAKSKVTLLLKEPAYIAGLELFEFVLRSLDADLKFEPLLSSPGFVAAVPAPIARISGNSRALLAAERTALNLIQRMSGIATLTSKFVELAAPSGIEILDTRKTTPTLRMIEKLAVKLAGGTNHRFGLYDGILIKDNHRAIAGGVRAAVSRARLNCPSVPIEVEVNTLEQLQEALELSVERVMLDNMSPAEVQSAVDIVKGRCYIEVSGGINLSSIKDYLIPGVNGISIGALTHSIKNIDLSLEFED
ncbi:MAG: carboxylating nicotinate-nucleotide diphosphorylase [Candidatus Obscuribacterales bacterium]|nr:carboxylating nicotinate-nucleotide diphosphorylase [Candidatus Obscuribacterales bacterium]